MPNQRQTPSAVDLVCFQRHNLRYCLPPKKVFSAPHGEIGLHDARRMSYGPDLPGHSTSGGFYRELDLEGGLVSVEELARSTANDKDVEETLPVQEFPIPKAR